MKQEKQLTDKDILAAKEVYLYNNDVLYVVDDFGEAYGFWKDGTTWFHKENFWDYFDSSLMLSYFDMLSKEAAVALYHTWQGAVMQRNQKLETAIIFATEHHAGQFRKGTTRPYILHPLETLQILNSMRADTNVLIAGVLHDTIEDTDATVEMIAERFGEDVAGLVAAHSEDKSKSWKERKTIAIEELGKADPRLQMLVMADKVSNLRNLLLDYQQLGNIVWERFNAPASEQAWYYGGIQDALYTMQNDKQCAAVYWEMVALYKDIFVEYFLDNTRLYQVCLDGTGYVLEKGNPEWMPLTREVPQSATALSRLVAERIEDTWNEQCIMSETPAM